MPIALPNRAKSLLAAGESEPCFSAWPAQGIHPKLKAFCDDIIALKEVEDVQRSCPANSNDRMT